MLTLNEINIVSSLLSSSTAVVRFSFTEDDYRNIEGSNVPARVSKNLRIAHPVLFYVFPLTIEEAFLNNITIPLRDILEFDPSSPNRAGIMK